MNLGSAAIIFGLAFVVVPAAHAAGAVKPVPVCELALNDPEAAVVNLLRAALEHRVLTAKLIQDAFNGSALVNPISEPTTPATVSWKQAFDQALTGLKSAEQTRLRQAVTAILDPVKKAERKIDRARKRTQAYAQPRLLSSQPVEGRIGRESVFFWQKTDAGNWRAVGVTAKSVNIWYPGAPEKAELKPHNVNVTHVQTGDSKWALRDVLAAKDDDILIAHRQFVFGGGDPKRNRISLYSYNTGGEIGFVETPGDPLELKLTQIADGGTYLIVRTDAAVESHHWEDGRFKLVHRIPMPASERASFFSGLLPGGEILVLARRSIAWGRSELLAYNPIHSETPFASWSLETHIDSFYPYVTRKGELVVAIRCLVEGIRASYPSMVYVRQSRPDIVKRKAKADYLPDHNVWFEDQRGRIKVLHVEKVMSGYAEVGLYEPFASPSEPVKLNGFFQGSRFSLYDIDNDASQSKPTPRVLSLSDGRRLLVFHTEESVAAYDLDDYALVANVPSYSLWDYRVAALPESGALMLVVNAASAGQQGVIFQELSSPQPTLSYGKEMAARFLPVVAGDDGSPWVAAVFRGAGDEADRIDFFALTSSVGGK